MKQNSRIYLAGHQGLVGSALLRKLTQLGFANIITATQDAVDLRNQSAVNAFFADTKPEYVFLAAAKVGGIKANYTFPAEFIYDNLIIEANCIHAAYKHNTKKLLFLGSSCIYPRLCTQPIREEYLLSGPLEPTNEPYAVAKIAGIKLCQAYNAQYGTQFITAMPTNLYGPHDNFNIETAHVIPALIAKIYQAHQENRPSVTLWGTGMARREFLFVDDVADALLFLMHNYSDSQHINVGTGTDTTINELAQLIQKIIGYQGNIYFDATMPDGTPRKVLDTNKINQLGWHASTALVDGLQKTIAWYVAQQQHAATFNTGALSCSTEKNV
jgi:GDP-L-fucose synthase